MKQIAKVSEDLLKKVAKKALKNLRKGKDVLDGVLEEAGGFLIEKIDIASFFKAAEGSTREYVRDSITKAVEAGVVSSIGGGKFKNGAGTAAFQRFLFGNAEEVKYSFLGSRYDLTLKPNGVGIKLEALRDVKELSSNILGWVTQTVVGASYDKGFFKGAEFVGVGLELSFSESDGFDYGFESNFPFDSDELEKFGRTQFPSINRIESRVEAFIERFKL